jgi:CubicO group peptidase (beta-lactamase class C family)
MRKSQTAGACFLGRSIVLGIGLLLVLFLLSGSSSPARESPKTTAVYPGDTWETRSPRDLGLSDLKLAALRDLVGGRGCVVRHGYMVYTWGDQSKSEDVASAMKPIISTFLLMAVEEGRLPGLDSPVADFEPRLKTLNGGKDGVITWRHLASQMSGYGLVEAPGQAYSYNDFALALYYDTLTEKVFGTNGTALLRTRLAVPLQFQDEYTFNAFGPKDRPGRLALSVRDFARFGLLYLRNGQWKDRQLLKPELARMATSSPISAETPLTSGKEVEMLPGQRSVGGTRNITPAGPGYYSFNWWLNRTNKLGQRLYVDGPADAFMASGHGGVRMLWVIPSLDLVVSWNDSPIDDHDQSPGNSGTRINQAARLIRESVLDENPASTASATILGVHGAQFTINGQPAFLLGASYYGGLGAPESFVRQDLNDLKQSGFNWIRVWANWGASENNLAVFDSDGNPREPFLSRLQWLVTECDQRGMLVDVTLSRGDSGAGQPQLLGLVAHRRAAETVITALKAHRNWYLDLSNERNIRDKRFTSMGDLKDLRQLARRLYPDLLVTASHGSDIEAEELAGYLNTVGVDFITPHRPRDKDSAAQTESATRDYSSRMRDLGRIVPVLYQEPFRRGYGNWQPVAEDYIADARGALDGGAAGWCFHNGSGGGQADEKLPRSFDLREKRLFEQLDAQELKVVQSLQNVVRQIRTP